MPINKVNIETKQIFLISSNFYAPAYFILEILIQRDKVLLKLFVKGKAHRNIISNFKLKDNLFFNILFRT